MEWSDTEIEILRRSIVMLPPGAPSGLSREQAMSLLTELASARAGVPPPEGARRADPPPAAAGAGRHAAKGRHPAGGAR